MPFNLIYSQEDFSGGMNLLGEDTRLAANEYRLLINGTSRFAGVTPVKDSRDIADGLPSVQIFQGLYAFGSLLVLFADGLAYYKPDASDTWVAIADFQMDQNVDRIYCCAVPASSMNYHRKNSGTTSPSSGITLLDTIATTSPVALVVQDGTNQPWVILADGTARVTSTYTEWDKDTNREYIPIGLQMVYFNGILFIVAADGLSIYRSVSGRPLDFVVAVDNNADKITNAVATSFAVDHNKVMLIAQLNSSSLVVMTAYTAYAVALDFDSRLYGEPTFDYTFLFTAGVTNQFSFADILGDFAFIDKEGLKSFNAVQQLKFQGNNGVFSLKVADLFKGVVQTDPCVGSFDNYTFFSVATSYAGSSILVYDSITKVFISLYILTNRPVRQFAATYTASNQRFFGLTSDGVHEFFSADVDTYRDACIFTRAYNTSNSDAGPTPIFGELKSTRLRMLFRDAPDAGVVYATELVDTKPQLVTYQRDIPRLNAPYNYPILFPTLANVTDSADLLTIPTKGKNGDKVSYVLTWTGGASLIKLQEELESTIAPSAVTQQEEVYAS